MADQKNVKIEEVVEADDFEEIKEEFNDVPGTEEETEMKAETVEVTKITKKEKVKWFSLGAAAGAVLASGLILLYAKFGIGDPGEAVQQIAEVTPEVVGA